MKMTKLSKLEKLIYEVRNQPVMLDSDLANLYQVETKVLNQAVKRNKDRFPIEFMFKLNNYEWDFLRSQFVTLKNQNIRVVRKYLPYVFTQAGVAMLSSVLNSKEAIKTNIQIMKAFTKMYQYVSLQPDLSIQVSDIRNILNLYMNKTDKRIDDIMIALSTLLTRLSSKQPEPKQKTIGFRSD
jgi:hypothetical protein